MARRPRLDLPGIPQHVIQRGNNRAVCFFDVEDYVAYLDFLSQASDKAGCSIHAYVLMTNHVHLLATAQEQRGMARMMQSLGRRYVRYVNDTYRRTGTLWEGRFRSTLVDSERYLLACYRYIELNPVRAALVSDPLEYPWSSYSHHVGACVDPLVGDHEVFLAIGRDPEQRAARYRELCQQGLREAELRRIRDRTNRGYVLGSKRFTRQIEAALRRRVTPGKPGRPPAGS